MQFSCFWTSRTSCVSETSRGLALGSVFSGGSGGIWGDRSSKVAKHKHCGSDHHKVIYQLEDNTIPASFLIHYHTSLPVFHSFSYVGEIHRGMHNFYYFFWWGSLAPGSIQGGLCVDSCQLNCKHGTDLEVEQQHRAAETDLLWVNHQRGFSLVEK